MLCGYRKIPGANPGGGILFLCGKCAGGKADKVFEEKPADAGGAAEGLDDLLKSLEDAESAVK